MLLHVTTWMKLADIKSSKIRQSRQPMHMIPHIWVSKGSQTYRNESGMVVAKDWHKRGMKS